jgi:hypothetical protein
MSPPSPEMIAAEQLRLDVTAAQREQLADIMRPVRGPSPRSASPPRPPSPGQPYPYRDGTAPRRAGGSDASAPLTGGGPNALGACGMVGSASAPNLSVPGRGERLPLNTAGTLVSSTPFTPRAMGTPRGTMPGTPRNPSSPRPESPRLSRLDSPRASSTIRGGEGAPLSARRSASPRAHFAPIVENNDHEATPTGLRLSA